ncbi:MAG: DUF2860 domain-containing protein [gamma proteobacterium symbiont of Bathyaustriella thionipta]|nr:DUF2860 domain-containing protein [gamma proteobacterium symbiont of Bathyaustriella thionipta]MCU7951478.1 DUF2860 domain-containing protein [gamma proteobacterium symbiont of Bathyaustriella thionipta]MCU7958049.1 DUF2860 domain-containing protein [gamma proteobacterium symbiont of Bathyaustriella thionipta]MCU7967700.1 DUF2860 domain-containing protein [gamma proteobacterium symbiont of Bathyaustriella thionipta]
MSSISFKTIVYSGLIGFSGLSYALDPIPSEDGFSGYINLGVAGIKGETNMIAGNSLGDVGQKNIDSLTDSPDSESDSMPLLNGEVTYTFAASRTQIYFGNQLEDFIQFDFSTLLGVRHELADKSLIAVSYVFSSVPTEVWEDPYLTNQRRSKTDRESNGLRLEWDKIAGTDLGIQYTYRNIELDDELSGQSLGLTASDMDLLDREGKVHNMEFRYKFNMGNGHSLQPKFNYIDRDMDGQAMSSDEWVLGLTHIYNSEQYSFITNLDWADADFDKKNPIYNKTRNDNRLGGSFTVVYKKPFGIKDWNLLGSIAYYDSDSNIDFYNTNIKFFSVSALYRF